MNEQLSLFDNPTTSMDEFALRICDEFNKLDTVWKGSFYVEKAALEHWDHVNLKEKVLSISLDARNRTDENHFMYLKGDEKSQRNLLTCGDASPYLGDLLKDKDFSFSPTPWSIYIFFHNFERKQVHG